MRRTGFGKQPRFRHASRTSRVRRDGTDRAPARGTGGTGDGGLVGVHALVDVGGDVAVDALHGRCRPREHVYEALPVLGLDGEDVDQCHHVLFGRDGCHLALLPARYWRTNWTIIGEASSARQVSEETCL